MRRDTHAVVAEFTHSDPEAAADHVRYVEEQLNTSPMWTLCRELSINPLLMDGAAPVD